MQTRIKLAFTGIIALGMLAGCGKGNDQTPAANSTQDIQHNLKQAGQNLSDAAHEAAKNAEPAVKHAAQEAQEAVHKAAQDVANRTATQPSQ